AGATRRGQRRAAGGPRVWLRAAVAGRRGSAVGAQRRAVRLVPWLPGRLRPGSRRRTAVVGGGPRGAGGPGAAGGGDPAGRRRPGRRGRARGDRGVRARGRAAVARRLHTGPAPPQAAALT